MPNNILYYNDKEMYLEGHHVKASVIKRLDKGYITVYDLTENDLNVYGREYLEIAKSKDLVVFLTVRNKKRLLIFNKTI